MVTSTEVILIVIIIDASLLMVMVLMPTLIIQKFGGGMGIKLQLGLNTVTVTDPKSTHITLTEASIKNQLHIRPVTTYPIYRNGFSTGLSNN